MWKQVELLKNHTYFSPYLIDIRFFIGYAGQISLGHAAFFGLGAYGSAIATVTFEIPPWPAMFLVATIVGLVALLIGIPILRLSGHYLAMATLGLSFVVHTILLQWDEVTGGPSGFSGIPYLSFGSFQFDDEVRLHYLLWGVTLISLLLCLNLVRSGVGRGLSALAGDEVAAAALGVNTRNAKIKIFVLSAVFASIAGSLFAHCYSFVSPDSFDIFASTDMVIMVVIGGMGSIWGSLFGAALITLLPEWMDLFETYKDFGWELCGQMASTYLWRMEYKDERPESFSDEAARKDRNSRFVKAVSFSFILFTGL